MDARLGALAKRIHSIDTALLLGGVLTPSAFREDAEFRAPLDGFTTRGTSAMLAGHPPASHGGGPEGGFIKNSW